ncbi:hypothetical protein F183_A02460 [Bryobacterales bacterium F-183]|nr:hypothetical protein F183_A02460 [Bryobacterales bacterium F-183]
MPDSLGPDSARNFRPDLARELEYLLGQMPRVDRETFQGQLIENSDISDRVVEAEQELFDAYARNRLPGEWRAAFEERLLSTPEGRAKLAVAHGLLRRSRPSTRRRWWIFSGLAATAAAAVLLLFTTCGILRPCESTQPAAVAIEETQVFELAAITRGQAQRPKLLLVPNATRYLELRVAEPADSFELSLVLDQRSIAKAGPGTSLRVDRQLLEPGIYLLTAFRNGTASNYYEFELVRP